MPARTGSGDARPVSAETTKHIAIDVRVDGDEISGQAGDGVGQARPFSGWLGLIWALDRLLAGREPARPAATED
jgi:hypothetical protein